MIGREPTGEVVSQPLTKREREVLSYMAEGLSNREIAARMVIALSTVKWYAQQIFNKLAVDSREEAVIRAQMLGLPLNTQVEPALRHNLPAQLSSFVGREREIAAIRQRLQKTRFVTLTGAGGTGKTRLALEVAALIGAEYPDGITFVPLAATKAHAFVPNAIAQELGVVGQPNQPLILGLQRFLARKKYLLFLDNFEHVIQSAPLVHDLLMAAPRLTLLVTSREPLNISGECEYLVPPLTLPDAEDGDMTAESVTLFVQRARMASRSFRMTEKNSPVIAAICRRLDGLPLALELAASRIKLLSPQQMLERLDSRLGLLVGGPRDLPARQQTLRATIDWSYHLLDADERRLFARLAVFNGGRTIEAVETVCYVDEETMLLEELESLLNKNLLYQEEGFSGEPRFYMLETIHEYARERLGESGQESRIRNRHLAYYLQLCEEMAPNYWGGTQLLLFEKTDAEFNNITTAFNWAMESEQIELAARLITAVNYYLRYTARGIVRGYHLNRRVLPFAEKIAIHHRVPFLIGASELAFQNSDVGPFRALAAQALTLARKLGDQRLTAWALINTVDFTGDVRRSAARHALWPRSIGHIQGPNRPAGHRLQFEPPG